VPVSNLAAKEIATGTQHACALAIDNTVQCWGSTTDGELGNGTITQAFFATPQMALGINDALHITAGEAFTCATLTDHTTKCWGDNLGPIPDASTLGFGRPIPGATGGPLPKPFFMDHPSFPVVGLTNAVYISGGATHACASGPGAAIHCWGLNEFGELADGNGKPSLVAVSP
jgi:alpha-tubulin suppressor-like RCC1 family protein